MYKAVLRAIRLDRNAADPIIAYAYAGSIRGRGLFCSARALVRELFKGRNFSMEGTIQANTVHLQLFNTLLILRVLIRVRSCQGDQ